MVSEGKALPENFIQVWYIRNKQILKHIMVYVFYS